MAGFVEFQRAERIPRGGGIESVRLTPEPLDGQQFVMGVTSFPPGASIRLHSHNTIEQVTVIEGEGIAELTGGHVTARPYDRTQGAPGGLLRLINRGDSTMRILWVYGSTDVSRTFADTGETVGQFEA